MSSFGSSGGRGGRSGGGRGRGSSRGSGRGRGGSSHHNNAGQGGQQGRGTSGVGAEAGRPRFKPCRAFTTTGSCPAGPGCTFSHVVQKHAELDATSPLPQPKNSSNYNNNGGYHNHNRNNNNNNNNNNEAHPVSGIALWEAPAAAPGQPAVIKVFNGSHDGHWRLWEPENGAFVRRFEHSMGGGGCKVECVKVASNFLFCGFEGVSRKLPHVKVGMIHAWNLANPSEAPLEFHIHEEFTPYAHAAGVSCLHITKETSQIISGCHNGVLRTWNYDGAQNKFVLQHTLSGHAGEITGLTTISPGGTAGAPPILWSGSTDCSIRLWDLTTGNCQYLITSETAATTDGAPMPTHASPNVGAPSTGPGHTEAITSLLALESPAGNFVLSSSLDGSVKAWNGSNGTCMASEMHGEGVVSMALATDPKGNPLLLLGLQEGIIMCRSVLQTPTTPAFTFLFALMPRYTIGHAGPVKSIEAGPASTFYTGGHDGKLLIFQITADLGL